MNEVINLFLNNEYFSLVTKLCNIKNARGGPIVMLCAEMMNLLNTCRELDVKMF